MCTMAVLECRMSVVREINLSRVIKLVLFHTFISVLLNQVLHVQCTTEVLRPRGVPLSKKVFYEPSKDFNCIDGSATIPFHFVNDDFCDCADGSDEPGTAACPNGIFHCVNAGHQSSDIPSSRVNDGICDCCDGSDEYNSSADCINICQELGRRAREEAEKQQELFQKGYALWKEYTLQGKQFKEDNKVKLEQLKKEEEEAQSIKNEKEAIKNEIEEKEKAVLAKYETAKEEKKKEEEENEMMQHQQEERLNAELAFAELDRNQDGILTYEEIKHFPKFDSDHDGTVSDEEAKFFLHMKEEMEVEEFVNTGWMIMKPIYMMDKLTTVAPSVSSPDDSFENAIAQEAEIKEFKENEREVEDLKDDLDHEQLDASDEEGDEALDEDEDEDENNGSPPEFPTKEDSVDADSQPPEAKEEPQYDEESQRIIDAAKHARQEFNDASQKLQKIEEEIRNVQQNIDADFGIEDEFAPLKGQCFDYSDREYTFRFCPFDRATQIPKSGGSDISLGRWSSWVGPEDNKYSKMKYEGGMVCWNGPARSVVISLQCGIENKLLTSSEPNRCEYHFDFSTPSMCSNLSSQIYRPHEHTEL